MTAADEWAGLARLAEAATPGPWEARRGDLTDAMTVVHDQEHVLFVADVGVWGMPRVEEDAEFIAAANPATVLRLITENRRLWNHARRNAAQRDELARRLAAVEAAIDRADPPGRMKAGTPSVSVPVLRAALSAAPTDTTKEQS